MGQIAYFDRPPLVTLPTNGNVDKCHKLLTRAYGPFRILQVFQHNLTVDENVIGNIVSIDRVTPVVETSERPRRYKASKTSTKERHTFYETDSITETVTTFSRNEYTFTEMGLPTPTQKNPMTSKEGLPNPTETLQCSRKTSLEYDYNPLRETTPSPTTLQTSTEDKNLEYVINTIV